MFFEPKYFYKEKSVINHYYIKIRFSVVGNLSYFLIEHFFGLGLIGLNVELSIHHFHHEGFVFTVAMFVSAKYNL